MDEARYELLELLGRGGMGSVYAAVHRPSGRRLAVKIPHELDATGLAQRLLLREAAAAARLRHRAIVTLVDVVRSPDGRLALVMELVEGPNLGIWAAEWPGWERLAMVLDDVLAGLSRAHGDGIIHRDLKLENVLVSAQGRAKITDFGIAADLDFRGGAEGQRALGGTPLYMAPEQFEARGHVGPWTDLYAFGVVLYLLLTGEPPFDEDTIPRLVLSKSQPRVHRALERAGVPDELRAAIDALLDPDPRRRPRFARQLRKLLASLPLGDLPEPVRAELPCSQRRTSGASESSLLTEALHVTESSVPTLLSTAPGAASTPASRPIESAPPVPAAFAETLPSTPSASPGKVEAKRAGLPPWLPAPLDPDLGVAVARLRDPQLVGRRAERELILDCMARLRKDGRARLLGLVGPAGVGKSTLARWGLAVAESEAGMEPLSTAYDAFGATGPGGLRHALTRLLGAPPPVEHGARWPVEWDWLRGEGEPPFDPVRVARWLSGDDSGGSSSAAEICFGVLKAAARVRPVYLWLDDLGWSHDGAIELAERLLAAPETPVLLVATFRSGTLEHGSVRAAAERLRSLERVEFHEVDNLSSDERFKLLSSVAPLEPALARALAERVDETALVAIELVHDWISKGLLTPTPQGLAADGGVEALLELRPPRAAVAARVEALLRAFGDRADLAENVLTRAALLGVAFDELALKAACASFDGSGEAVHEVLDRALLSGILRPESRDAYRFDHQVLRAALADRLEARADRAAIYADTSRGLIARIGTARPELLGHAAALLRQTDRKSREPWLVLTDSILTLARGSSFASAARHVELGRTWLDEDREDLEWKRAKLESAQAFAAFCASEYDEAEAALERATRSARLARDDSLLRRCFTLEVQLMLYQDRLAEAAEAASRSLQNLDAEGLEDPWTRGMMHHALSEFYSKSGDGLAALVQTELMVDCARPETGAARNRVARCNRAQRLMSLGRFEEADRQLSELEREAEESGDTGSAIEIHESRMLFLASTDDFAALRGAGVERRAHETEGAGDHWRLTGLRLLEALVAAHLDDDAHAAWAAARFISAFEHTHNDETLVRGLMVKLVAALEARRLTEQASRVRELHSRRGAAIARSLAPRHGPGG